MKTHTRQHIEEKTRRLAEPLLAAEGFELLDVEYLHAHRWILRLYIHQPGRAVGIEDCAAASRAIDRALDIEDFMPHAYELEVSSPGVQRPLKKPQHFEQVKGQRIRLKTSTPLFEPPRKNFAGILTDVTVHDITVEVPEAGLCIIPFQDVARAHLDADWVKTSK